MKTTYLLTGESEITAYPSRAEALEACKALGDEGLYAGFDSAESLQAILETSPSGRAIEIWNSLPGVEPLELPRFRNKKTAAERIFKALQSLGNGDGAQDGEGVPEEAPAEPVAKPKRVKATRKPKATVKPRKSAKNARSGKKAVSKHSSGDSKKSQVIEMISKKGGATLDAIMQATGWLPHTTRGAISTLASKGGYVIESFKTEAGERAYRIE